MKFISPLTLLIIPIIGSIIIITISDKPLTPKYKNYSSSLLSQSMIAQRNKEELINENKNMVLSASGTPNLMLALPNGAEILKSSESPLIKNTEKNDSLLKKIALLTSIINFIVSFTMWIQFDPNYSGYQFVTQLDQISFLNIHLGVDGISLFFVLLTTFITPIALLSSHNEIEKNLKFYLVLILLLETLQIAVFVALDLLLFYVFFESVLIPLFIIIGIWGASEAKIRAAFLLFLYTLFGSLFMLLAILNIYAHLGSTDFNLLSVTELSFSTQVYLFFAFFIAFAIKTPLWPFTGWLFRAHVEAPLSGSVILAAIILKLATYAFLRILINFLPDATYFFTPLIQGICIVTLIYASLSALRSHDSKALVALSSISHCALIVLGLFSNTVIGIIGGILVSLGHGFISPALFIIVGGIIYSRLHTRVIPYIRGLTTYMPILSIFFLIFALANASIPLTIGWVGEQMTLIGTFESSPIAGILGATSIFLTACYSIFLYNRTMFGDYSKHIAPVKDTDKKEVFVLVSLLIPTILFGIWPNFIIDSLHLSTSNLIYDMSSIGL